MQKPLEKVNILRLLILLTLLFIAAQVTFLILGEFFADLFDVTLYSFTTNLFFSYPVFVSFLQFLLGQSIVYSVFIFLMWYVITSIYDNFKLGYKSAFILTLFIWMNCVVGLLAWNSVYVPHSIFTKLIRHHLFNDILSDGNFRAILYFTIVVSLAVLSAAIGSMFSDLYTKKNIVRHTLMLSLLSIVGVGFGIQAYQGGARKTDGATAEKPNIFIIGFDAVRPDYLSYFNKKAKPTPYFDAFLQSAIVFPRAYTPIARTMPSWANILTGQYPVHNQIRENNTLLDLIKINDTLPKHLQALGYTTIYATDDRRFNNIDERFGFDEIVGPAGTVPDFMLGTLNDFPLSNLIATTAFGKVLFPYSYANHGADFIYNPNNFLTEINRTLRTTSEKKPIFMSVHFNLTGWPFYWYNDHAAYNADLLQRYTNAVGGDDKLLANFFILLKKNQLLNHALVFLISDHGITQGLHNDRVVQEANYQGLADQMKLRRFKYADAKDMKIDIGAFNAKNKQIKFINQKSSPFDLRNVGIDTSYGYGSDVLSLKQNLSLFAVRGFGLNIGVPHQVEGRSLLLDIAPTILDLVSAAPLKNADGISLKSYLFNAKAKIADRPIYIESTYTNSAMEQKDILMAKVLAQSLKFFYINPRSGAVNIYPPLLKVLLENKQRAILEGEWLLAYYPVSERYKFIKYDPKNADKGNNLIITSNNKKGDKQSYTIKKYLLSPYFVLVNLKTGKWTTSLDNPLAEKSPVNAMRDEMDLFYGDEMLNYG